MCVIMIGLGDQGFAIDDQGLVFEFEDLRLMIGIYNSGLELKLGIGIRI